LSRQEELEQAMLFHVTITVRMPHEVDPNRVKQLRERERERAADLQPQGKCLHLWRVAGKSANVSIFDVESPAELHEVLESLPSIRGGGGSLPAPRIDPRH